MSVFVTTLNELLLNPDTRPRVISDAISLVETEVQGKGGISGMAIKTGYAAVKRFKPSLIPDAVDSLIDRFVDKLEPFYTEWAGQGTNGSFGDHLRSQSNTVANALLAVTDERAQQIQADLIKKTYDRLRPMGEKNVEAAVPGLARTIDGLLPKAS